MKTYAFIEKGRGQFQVLRVNNRYPAGHEKRFNEYLVDLMNPAMLCSCKHWYFTHFIVPKKGSDGIWRNVFLPCQHFQFVVAQLESGGNAIHPDIPGIVDKLFKEVEKDEKGRYDHDRISKVQSL